MMTNKNPRKQMMKKKKTNGTERRNKMKRVRAEPLKKKINKMK